MSDETLQEYRVEMGGQFGALACTVAERPWPSVDADGVATDALGRICRAEGTLDDAAWLLWYVAVYAQSEKVPLQSVADRLTAMLARLPPTHYAMAR